MNARDRLAAWLKPATSNLARWLASFIEWLRTRGAWPVLIAIAVLTVASVLLITNELVPQLATGVVMALLGVALVLGCLFAFPYAGVWREDRPASPEDYRKFVNDIRTMLISIVVGAFGLVTIYLTLVSAQAAAKSAVASENQVEVAKKEAAASRLASAGDLMNSNNAGVRLIGVATLSRLIDDDGVEPVDGYRSLAAYVRDRSVWTAEKRTAWAALSELEGRAAENHPRVGVGSLRKRAPDVQSALSVVGAGKKPAPGLRVDLQDVDLQGAALGHARLPRALFNGAHLDYLDTRTGEEPYASFAEAEFKGAKLYGAYFHNAQLARARFETPHQRQVTDLRLAEFRGASAVDAHFEGADLRGAVFTPSRVGRTILQRAHFNGADLRGARFDGSDLTGADFSEARLEGASFKGADLSAVNFDLADLKGVTYDPGTIWPAGFYAPPNRTVIE
jgi:uncharacterized protein YjbI with pentapeptide repeats